MAWNGSADRKCERALMWVVVPMWVIMVVFAIVSTGLVSSVIISNADFCSGGDQETPDETVKNILIEQNISPTALLFELVYYYVTGCGTKNPWDFLDNYRNNLVGDGFILIELNS